MRRGPAGADTLLPRLMQLLARCAAADRAGLAAASSAR
jgi:hypothetical protein